MKLADADLAQARRELASVTADRDDARKDVAEYAKQLGETKAAFLKQIRELKVDTPKPIA